MCQDRDRYGRYDCRRQERELLLHSSSQLQTILGPLGCQWSSVRRPDRLQWDPLSQMRRDVGKKFFNPRDKVVFFPTRVSHMGSDLGFLGDMTEYLNEPNTSLMWMRSNANFALGTIFTTRGNFLTSPFLLRCDRPRLLFAVTTPRPSLSCRVSSNYASNVRTPLRRNSNYFPLPLM